MRRLRRTKIVATLGPASSDRRVIASLFKAGADVLRINMSHTSHARMRELTVQLAARNRDRVIIFDSSPLLATNESQVLAKLVGQIQLVVRANGTPRAAVEEAVALLDRSKYVGLVLNQLRTLFGLGSYYSGHYNYN